MTMNAALRIAFILAALSLGSCAADDRPIPDGAYAYGEERVVIDGGRIRFHVVSPTSGSLLDRECDYTVLPNGRIQPYPLASTEALWGVGGYDWFWDGERIVRTAPRSGETVDFVRSD